MKKDFNDIVNSLPSDEQLDLSDERDDEDFYPEIEDEDVSFYASLYNDDSMAHIVRNIIMSYSDKTNSKSAEECYLKNTIANRQALAEVARREMEYEQLR